MTSQSAYLGGLASYGSAWWRGGGAILVPAIAILSFLILLPLSALLMEALTDNDGGATLSNFLRTLSDEHNREAVWNTIGLSLAVALLSLVFAALFAFGLSRTTMPLKKTLQRPTP